MCYAALLTRPCPRFCSLANWMNTKTDANSINQSRTVCASRKSWNANQLTAKSKRLAVIISKLSIFDMFMLLTSYCYQKSLLERRCLNVIGQPRASSHVGGSALMSNLCRGLLLLPHRPAVL